MPDPLYHPRLIVGYHGCDRSTLERVLLRDEELSPSRNPWDWLGEGVYFWEQGLERAWEFAEEQRQRGQVQEPAVLGAYIYLGRCFDLTDRWATLQLDGWFRDYSDFLAAFGRPLPANRAATPGDHDLLLRNLDCGMLNFAMQSSDVKSGGGRFHFQTIRGVFTEGEPAFPGSKILAKTHIQIAVRDPEMILGYLDAGGDIHPDYDWTPERYAREFGPRPAAEVKPASSAG